MKAFQFSILILIIFLSSFIYAQTARNYAVELTAKTIESPPQIILNWKKDISSNGYQIRRMLKGSSSWGGVLASANGSDTSFTDTTVLLNTQYEYIVINQGSNYQGIGFINAGIKIAPKFDRGNIILVIDTTNIANFKDELFQLKLDLVGDGYSIQILEISPNDKVLLIKNEIRALANKIPTTTSAVLLIGNVPVPYSGELNPDAHGDHIGAWPCDAYYGETSLLWTDNTVNNTSASDSRNHNIVGDGKWDQSYFPDKIDMAVGRIDFSNLPVFTQSESQLIKNYLSNNHAYRHGKISIKKRALIDDNFGAFGGEAFSATAWMNFANFYSSDSIFELDYRSTLKNNPYQWSFGCGAGSYTSCSGIGNSSNFAGDSLQTIFTCLFGSYFGDWDKTNNYLRAAVAQGTTLTNIWAGRPRYFFHGMAMGDPIGSSLVLSQNNDNSVYFSPIPGLNKTVQMTLMGDPSLRLHPVIPPTAITVSSPSPNIAHISWISSSDNNINGYHIFRSRNLFGPYEKVNTQIQTGNSYTDSCMYDSGMVYYMVRAEKAETSQTGTYANLSQGIFDSVFSNSSNRPKAYFTVQMSSTFVHFNNLSTNANSFRWDFGDGGNSTSKTTSHQFVDSGYHNVRLIASNECTSDTFLHVIHLFPSNVGINNMDNPRIEFYPNPASSYIILKSDVSVEKVTVYDLLGKEILSIDSPKSGRSINLKNFVAGYYFFVVKLEGQYLTHKLFISR